MVCDIVAIMVINGNLCNTMTSCVASGCLNVNNRVHEFYPKKFASQGYKNSPTDFHLAILQVVGKYGR